MAKQTQETILRSFLEVSAGLPDSSVRGTSEPVSEKEPQELASILADATRAVTGGSQGLLGGLLSGNPILDTVAGATGTSGGSTGSSVANTVLKSGLGIVPLVAGLFHLFGGSSEPEPPPLVKYQAPAPVQFSAAQWGDELGDVDYDESGLPRVYRETQTHTAASNTTRPAEIQETSDGSRQASAPVINVNVQAMDSRSFLDHSQDIARAVREAMLNLNSINDVVNDL